MIHGKGLGNDVINSSREGSIWQPKAEITPIFPDFIYPSLNNPNLGKMYNEWL